MISPPSDIRLRARAMVLLMRHAGLRVSDVVTLSRDHVEGRPKAAPEDCSWYFASGEASVRSLVKCAQGTMAVVFERAGVPDGHCHRFRHTLATELKGQGATDEEIAGILAALNDPPALREVESRVSNPPRQRTQKPWHEIGTGERSSEITLISKILMWWPGTESNRRRQPFQGWGLPLSSD